MKLIGNPNELPFGGTPEPGAFTRPRMCAVIPQRTTDPEGFIDTGNVFPGTDAPVLVSVAAVREMARLIGLVDPADYDPQIEAQADRIAQLKAEVDRAVELENARNLVAEADKEKPSV